MGTRLGWVPDYQYSCTQTKGQHSQNTFISQPGNEGNNRSSSHRCVGQQILASIHPCKSLETQG